MSTIRCRACGKPIIYMKTQAGKSMPCDAELVPYWGSETGTKRVLNHSGELVRCELAGNHDDVTGVGRTPHWGTCTSPNQFRKRGKTHEPGRA